MSKLIESNTARCNNRSSYQFTAPTCKSLFPNVSKTNKRFFLTGWVPVQHRGSVLNFFLPWLRPLHVTQEPKNVCWRILCKFTCFREKVICCLCICSCIGRSSHFLGVTRRTYGWEVRELLVFLSILRRRHFSSTCLFRRTITTCSSLDKKQQASCSFPNRC